MDLQKMREFGLVSQAQLVFEMFKSQFQYGDQDILNIIFHYFPGTYKMLFHLLRIIFVSLKKKKLFFQFY